MKTYTKESLIVELKKIASIGWIENARHGNDGGIGNTLEDLLEIEENNLPIPNATEWELKSQRLGTTALTTLFHSELSPRAMKFIPQILLPQYGWSHKQAYGIPKQKRVLGKQYMETLAVTGALWLRLIRKREKYSSLLTIALLQKSILIG